MTIFRETVTLCIILQPIKLKIVLLTWVTALSSERKVHLTAAGKAFTTKIWLKGLDWMVGFSPDLLLLTTPYARTRVCKISNATAWSPVETLSPSASVKIMKIQNFNQILQRLNSKFSFNFLISLISSWYNTQKVWKIVH